MGHRVHVGFASLCLLVGCAGGVLGKGARARARDPDPRWGRLASRGFEGQCIKTTLFFSGQARDGSNPYGCNPAANLGLYTAHPVDPRHLNWTSDPPSRGFALDEMARAGINVINMSSWGETFLPCSTGWVPYAPMQTSPQSHDELLVALGGRPLLMAPFIESRGDWTFYNEFPRWIDGRVAPGTVSQMEELIRRYLKNSVHPEWAGRWARYYDRDGVERYGFTIIHASSNRLGQGDHAAYATGFRDLAEEVFSATGVRVGFFIDALPPGTNAPGAFKPTPEETGPLLKAEPSILGIQCFIPEVWVGSSDDDALLKWKRDFSRRWAETGIPFVMDVSPGYDAHLVFPGSVRYGLNATWRDRLTAMVGDYGEDGVAFNSWNGYTEGMAAVPTDEHGSVNDEWLQFLDCVARPGFRRGDGDGDGRIGLSDAVVLLLHMFVHVPLPCSDAADCNDDGRINLPDVLQLLVFIFLQRNPPVAPGPKDCGPDPTPLDGLDCELYTTCAG